MLYCAARLRPCFTDPARPRAPIDRPELIHGDHDGTTQRARYADEDPARPRSRYLPPPGSHQPAAPRRGHPAVFPQEQTQAAGRYRYDSSLSPELAWDGGNAARELGEWLIGLIADPKGFENPAGAEFRDARGEVAARVRTVQEAAELLAAIARPFLNWAGKSERLSFDVPTLPLFIHERLSTQAILETLTGHRRDTQLSFFDLFGDPNRPIRDQVLRALRVSRRLDQPHDPGRFAGGDELAAGV